MSVLASGSSPSDFAWQLSKLDSLLASLLSVARWGGWYFHPSIVPLRVVVLGNVTIELAFSVAKRIW